MVDAKPPVQQHLIVTAQQTITICCLVNHPLPRVGTRKAASGPCGSSGNRERPGKQTSGSASFSRILLFLLSYLNHDIVGVSHILGLGVCTVVGVTGGHAPWDAKSGVDRLFVSLASMYLTIKISTILSFKCSRFILPSSRSSATYSYRYCFY